MAGHRALAACVPRWHRSLCSSSTTLRTRRPGASATDEADLGRHFYLNKVLEQWAARPATRMTLRQLVFFGKTIGRDREKILRSANYVRQELPIRIAHRIRDLQALPFVVMSNKHLEDVYNKYWEAFETFRKLAPIRTMEENDRFCALLKRLLEDHLTIIPSLTIGIVESSHHLPAAQLDKFMERMLRSRISRRVLAEQHIALSEALDDPFHFFNEPTPGDGTQLSTSHPSADPLADIGDHVGIIYTHLSIAAVVHKGIRLLRALFAGDAKGTHIPDVVLDGDMGARFAYIPEHLEYIVFELLKNAMRATMRRDPSLWDQVPIRVTIVEGPPDEDLIIRISDSGGGLPNLTYKLQSSQYAAQAPPVSAASRTAATAVSAPRTSPSAIADLADSTVPLTLPSSRASPWDLHMPPGGPAAPPQQQQQQQQHAPALSLSTATEPLVEVLCSFSNVRRRLELEERLQRERRRRADDDDDDDEGGAREAPRHHESVGSVQGIGSLDRLRALRSVGTFKGTVGEQMMHRALDEEMRDDYDALASADAQRHAPWAPRGDEGTSRAVLQGVQAETGLGLPMTKVYCDFFGGSLTFRSLDGHSTDIFIRLPKLGTKKEAIEEIVF